ncbi:MAG: hypothetical protein HGA54_01125 [Actinobacteria bacterium]|nr:hypothetical protein [Actinomycetota bacterium]
MAEEIVVEMSEVLEKVAYFALDEARQKLEQGGDLVPFTVLADGDNMFIETHPGDTTGECFSSARKVVDAARKEIACYVFCYDGYVDTDDGEQDAIIIECAEKDSDIGHALCLVYTIDEDVLTFEEAPAYLGETLSFFDESVDWDAEEFDEDDEFEDFDDELEEDLEIDEDEESEDEEEVEDTEEDEK